MLVQFRISLSLLFICSFFAGLSQSDNKGIQVIDYKEKPEQYALFPRQVSETSGLIWFDNSIWTFNDSGGKPELYRIDSAGQVTQTVILEKAKNVDWEDITQDERFIYVGDFGNNLGNRDDLTIYKIQKSDIIKGPKITVTSERILFNYTDQNDFSIKNRKNNYDCESLICFGDSLIIFTKNWVDRKSRMYKLGKIPGRYGLNPHGEFPADGLVTGASFDAANNELLLIGYKNFIPFIWLIRNFDGNSISGDGLVRINLLGLINSQTEGICRENKEVIISTEARGDYIQGAYRINLSEIIALDKKGKP